MIRLPLEEKSVAELVREMDEILRLYENAPEMTHEEQMEDDAAHGYFEDD